MTKTLTEEKSKYLTRHHTLREKMTIRKTVT